jgi:hypothetical protein
MFFVKKHCNINANIQTNVPYLACFAHRYKQLKQAYMPWPPLATQYNIEPIPFCATLLEVAEASMLVLLSAASWAVSETFFYKKHGKHYKINVFYYPGLLTYINMPIA